MSESSGIDSISGGSMPKPYSNDLRARVIETIEAGASRREAAERYEISASAAVLWAQRWEETGSFAAKPSGGGTSLSERWFRSTRGGRFNLRRIGIATRHGRTAPAFRRDHFCGAPCGGAHALQVEGRA